MNLSDKDMLELLDLMALNADTAKIAKHYLEGLGRDASVKERKSKFIELLIRDGSAMGFEPGDDIGDIVWCLDDIADHFHLLLSSSWFSESEGMIGWLKTLDERWGRSGVRLLHIEDPKGRVFPVYVTDEKAIPAILEKAGEAGIGICMVSELAGEEEDDEENEAIDWSLG